MISASLVLFDNSPQLYGVAIQSFLDGVPDGLLIVSDNSPEPLQHPLFLHERVRYIFNDANLGFGRAHNRAIAVLPGASEFHLLLNPDVRFGLEVLPELVRVMRADPAIGAVMPRINYPDGSLQRLCKLLPTPVDLILRRFIPSQAIRQWTNRRYEMHALPQDAVVEVPTLSGCCLLVRTHLLRVLGGFDERYFMYMEDVDLVRRIGDRAKTVYVPAVSVVHEYAKGSYINQKLLGYHLKSALKYFAKWGWLLDTVRSERNRKALQTIQRHLDG